MQKMKIYIASSWRNQHAVEMLTALLREKEHEVLSFVENNYESGHGAEKGIPFEDWMKTPSSQKAFVYDTLSAMTADLVIYISPSGQDASAECGMAYAKGVPIFGLYAKGEDFGLMRKMVTVWFDRYNDLLDKVQEFAQAFIEND